MVRKKVGPGLLSRDASTAVADWKQDDTSRQFVLHIAVVCDDDPDDLKHIDDALDDIRGVGSADVYEVEELGQDDPRRLKH